MKSMNFNEDVWVRLTPYGEQIWDQYWFPTSPSGVPASIKSSHTEPSGLVRFHLWELLAVFGKIVYMGNPNVPFQDLRLYLNPEGEA